MKNKFRFLLMALIPSLVGMSEEVSPVAPQRTVVAVPEEYVGNSTQNPTWYNKADLQTLGWWSNGLPGGLGWTVEFSRPTAKTPYVINSAQIDLEHLHVSAADFYVTSDQPFCFNSETNSVVTGSGSGSLKFVCPVYFGSSVLWNARDLILIMDEMTVSGTLNLSRHLGVDRSVLKSVAPKVVVSTLKGAGHADNNDRYSALYLSGTWKALTSFTATNVSEFAGTISARNAILHAAAGDSTYNGVTRRLAEGGRLLHMDASDAATISFAYANRISEWRSKVGENAATPLRTDKYPVFRENELGTKPVVDFADWSSKGCGSPLRLATPVTGARTVVMVIGTTRGGGWLWGSSDSSTRTFHRNGTGNSHGNVIAYPWADDNQPKYKGDKHRAWSNNRTIDLWSATPNGSYEILTLEATEEDFNPICGFAFDHYGEGSIKDRDGHQQLAEFIVYDHVLSEEERLQTEAYLHDKWLKGTVGLPTLIGRERVTVDVLEPLEDGAELHLGRFTGRAELTKTGSGKLVLDRPREVIYPVKIQEGTLVVENAQNAPRFEGVTAAVPENGLIFHLDAADASTISLDSDRCSVTEWRSLVGENKLVPGQESKYPSAPAPRLKAKASNGKAMVDFGRFAGLYDSAPVSAFMDLSSRITNAKTVLLVADMRYGGGHILADTTAGNKTTFHRGKPAENGTVVYSTYDISSGLLGGSTPQADWRVYEDLVGIKATVRTPKGRPQVLSFSGNSTAGVIGRLGMDRNYKPRSGGIAYGEILVYNRDLTDVEIAQATRYLTEKWISDDEPQLQTVIAAGDVALEARTPIKVGTLSGSGTLTAKGGTIHVDNISDFTGALGTADGGSWSFTTRGETPTTMTVTDGLLAHFDPSDTSKLTTNANGEITELVSENDPSLVATPLASMKAALTGSGPTGLTVIDCDKYTSQRGLAWSTSFTTAQTVIAVIEPVDGGVSVFGSDAYNGTSYNNAFARYGGENPHFEYPIFEVFSKVQPGLHNAEVYLNGVHAGYGEGGYKKGYQVLSLTAPSAFAINWMGYRQVDGSNKRGGSFRYGETLVWNRILSTEERQQVEAYLSAKWLGKAIHGYEIDGQPSIPMFAVSKAQTFAVTADKPTAVKGLVGEGAFEKSGDETLSLKGSVAAFSGDLVVAEGTLTYAAAKQEVAVPELSGLLAHFDATQNVTVDANGTVTAWTACGGVAPFKDYVATPRWSTNTSWPKVATTPTGLAAIDFGPYGDKGAGLWFDVAQNSSAHTKVSSDVTYGVVDGVITSVLVFNSEAGGGFVLGNLGDDWYHRTKPYNDPASNVLGYNVKDKDSVIADGRDCGASGENAFNGDWQIIEINKSQTIYSDVAGFAFDRTFTDRNGGQKLADAFFFDHKLTGDELVALRKYLNRRWFARRQYSGEMYMYADDPQAKSVTVAPGATLALNGYKQTVGTLTCSGSITGGDVVVTEGLAFVPGEEVSVTGALTLPQIGEVIVPSNWKPVPGKYKIATASSVTLPKNWMGSFNYGETRFSTFLSTENNKVYLSIVGPGMLLILR